MLPLPSPTLFRFIAKFRESMLSLTNIQYPLPETSWLSSRTERSEERNLGAKREFGPPLEMTSPNHEIVDKALPNVTPRKPGSRST